MPGRVSGTISCSLGCIREREYEKVRSILDQLQVDAFEYLFIFGWEGLDEEVRRARALGKNFISVHGLKRSGKYFSNPNFRREAHSLLSTMIDFTYSLEAEILTLHCWDFEPPFDFDNCLSCLLGAEKYARDCGVRVSLENLPSSFMEPLPVLNKFDKLLPETFGFTLDLEFAAHHGIVDDLLSSPRLCNVHVKDYDGLRFEGTRRMYARIGEGCLDLRKILVAARKRKYEGPFTLETPHESAADICHTLTMLKSYLI